MIKDDGNESLRNRSCFGLDLRNTTNMMSGNNSSQSGAPFSGVGFPNFHSEHFRQPVASQLQLPQKIVDQFCGLSSESEDVWSEPDRDVSRARIGLDDSVTTFEPISHNSKYKHKNKRRASVGMTYITVTLKSCRRKSIKSIACAPI
jgi:hypothetical protein